MGEDQEHYGKEEIKEAVGFGVGDRISFRTADSPDTARIGVIKSIDTSSKDKSAPVYVIVVYCL